MPLAIEHLQNAFQWTWQTSAQASLFVCLILLVLFIWGRRLSPRWRMAFGLLILMRLMIPVLPESSFSYLNLLPTKRVPTAAPGETNPAPWIDHSHALPQHAPVSNIAPSISSPPATSINQTSSPADIREITYQSLEENELSTSEINTVGGLVAPELLSVGGSIIWLLGMLSMVSATLIRRKRLLRKIKNLPPIPERSKTANIYSHCLAKLNIARTIPVVECSQIETATVFGFLRPVILISPRLEQNFSNGEIRNILLHELAHIQRADILWNWLAFTVQTVHWFNPLAYLATRRFRADRELACDARVLKCLSSDEHKQYGNTLIKIAEINTNEPIRLHPALAPFFHRKSEIKNRITMIAKPNKLSKLSHATLALLLGLVFSVAFTRAADDQPEKRRDTPKQRKEGTGKPECADCEKTQKDKPSPRENEQRDPQPERKADKGRPPHPSEGRKPQDMPPDARKFAERVREFHQQIGDLHREGNSEAARDVQEELQKFIKGHAELTRRTGPAINGLGSRPGPDPDRRPERHPAERPGRQDDKPDGEGHEIARRIEHMQLAAENLEQAGMHEQARNLHQQAEQMERELHRTREGEGSGHGEQVEREMRELHGVIDQLKNEIEQLKAELHKRDGRK